MSAIVQPDILHLEACNFVDKPMGGQLTFSRQLMKVFGSRLALVGWASAPSEPVGHWFDKNIEGTAYRYFAIGRDRPSSSKPLVPARLTACLQVRRYLPRILSIGIKNIIVEEHAILIAMNLTTPYNLCYCFPGVEAPLIVSRYPWAMKFDTVFDYLFFQSLARKANCILAAADELAIMGLKHRAGNHLKDRNILSFPTRVDTDIFHPTDRLTTRKKLGLPPDTIIAVTTGRIHWAKGWPFLLDSFRVFLDRYPGSLLIFVGDGTERDALKEKLLALGLQKNVVVTGYQPQAMTAAYIQAANLFVMGSIKEGWSTSLLEALASHVSIVTTRFSSADTIVRQGINGFVVPRDPLEFSKAMETALNLPEVAIYAKSVIDHYALKNLAHDLLRVWPLM
jgi:glycosyltransferase involved in cell wall biosynthesis